MDIHFTLLSIWVHQNSTHTLVQKCQAILLSTLLQVFNSVSLIPSYRGYSVLYLIFLFIAFFAGRCFFLKFLTCVQSTIAGLYIFWILFCLFTYRSGVRHTNMLLRGAVFRNFSINFFTYGFPVGAFITLFILFTTNSFYCFRSYSFLNSDHFYLPIDCWFGTLLQMYFVSFPEVFVSMVIVNLSLKGL